MIACLSDNNVLLCCCSPARRWLSYLQRWYHFLGTAIPTVVIAVVVMVVADIVVDFMLSL